MTGDQAAVAVLEAEAADEADIRELMDSGLLPVDSAEGAEADGDAEFGEEGDEADELGSNGTGWDDSGDESDDDTES
jgi:hypothetical protein